MINKNYKPGKFGDSSKFQDCKSATKCKIINQRARPTEGRRAELSVSGGAAA